MLDALTIRLFPAPSAAPRRIVGTALAVVEKAGGRIDTGAVPVNIVNTLAPARALVGAFNIWSIFDATHPFRGFDPLAAHLLGAPESGGIEEFPEYRQLGLPLLRVSDLVIALRLRASPLAIELGVLPLSLARGIGRPKALADLLIVLMRGVGCDTAVGAVSDAWLSAGRTGQPKDPTLIAGQSIPRGYQALATDGVVSVARRPTRAVVEPADPPAVAEDPYRPHWTGATPRFDGERNGGDNAQRHFEKHVVLGREWSKEEVPSVEAYLARAVVLADAGEYEFYQPANQAVIKYSPTANALAIARRSSGVILTHFRPDSPEYVLRKVRSSAWVAPPIGGVVAYARPPSPEDAALADRLDLWDALVSEALSNVGSLAMASETAAWPVAVALGAATRIERERHGLLGLYVPDERQAEMEERLLKAEEVFGALEAVFRTGSRRGHLAGLLGECSGHLEQLALAAVLSEEDRAEFDDAVALFSDAVSAVGAESAFERDLPDEAQMALRAAAAAWRALSDC